MVPAIIADYAFSRFGTVVDVGGGDGTLPAGLLRALPVRRSFTQVSDGAHQRGGEDCARYDEQQGQAQPQRGGGHGEPGQAGVHSEPAVSDGEVGADQGGQRGSCGIRAKARRRYARRRATAVG